MCHLKTASKKAKLDIAPLWFIRAVSQNKSLFFITYSVCDFVLLATGKEKTNTIGKVSFL
jgi:hypothetical protein